MAFTLNRRLSTLVASNGQLNTGKIPNGEITTAMLHSGFTVSSGHLGSIDSDAVSEGSSNLYFTNARVDSRLSGGTGVTYSSGAISIGQAVATTDNVTFADLTVTGNLTITGDIDSYNVTDLDVTDKTITIGKGQTESNSGGSGLIVDGASASILWDESNDEFDINKGLNVTGDLVVDTNTLKVDATNNRVGIGNASPDVSLDIGSVTDAIHVPVGTTGQRPSSPAAGYFRYNSTTGKFEGYTTEWGAIAGGGGSAKEVDNFTGDGSTTAFTLSSTVADEDNLMVFIEGVYQNKADFVASGTTLTFDAAPANGRKIVVHHVKSSISGTNTVLDSFNANGSTTAFTLSLAPGSENNTQIFIDGVYQQKTDYTVSGTTLTFDTAPANGATIEVMIFTLTTVNAPAAGTVTSASIASGDFAFDTNTLAIDATNNKVGIGTTSPAETLEVYATEASGGVELLLTNVGDGGSGTVPYTAIRSRLNSIRNGGEIRFGRDSNYGSAANADSNIQFYTALNDTNTERMRIDSSGRVGINRTPAISNSKLEVGGADDVPLINVEASGATGGMGIGSTGLQFYHGTTARMRINSDGAIKSSSGGMVLQTKEEYNGTAATVTGSGTTVVVGMDITVKDGSKVAVWFHSGQILNNSTGTNPNGHLQWVHGSGGSQTITNITNQNHNHYWWDQTDNIDRNFFSTQGMSGTLSAGTYNIRFLGGTYQGTTIWNYQGQGSHLIVQEIAAN